MQFNTLPPFIDYADWLAKQAQSVPLAGGFCLCLYCSSQGKAASLEWGQHHAVNLMRAPQDSAATNTWQRTMLQQTLGRVLLHLYPCSVGGSCCRCQHTRGHLHPQQAPRHNLRLQATPAMTSLQMNMTVLNKRNGGNAAKAGSAFLALTCLMGIVQRPVGGVDIKGWFPVLG